MRMRSTRYDGSSNRSEGADALTTPTHRQVFERHRSSPAQSENIEQLSPLIRSGPHVPRPDLAPIQCSSAGQSDVYWHVLPLACRASGAPGGCASTSATIRTIDCSDFATSAASFGAVT